MFTGIITHIGEVIAAQPREGDLRLTVASGLTPGDVAIGASVAHDGVCLTMVKEQAQADGAAHVYDVSNETLSKTTLGEWSVGRRVNIERAARFGDEIGGHMVSGHIDGVGRLVGRAEDSRSLRLTFEAPQSLAPLIAPKGSIAINGVSLTVNEVDGARFGVNIIPHTAAETNLGALQVDARVNLEADMLARYLERMLQQRAAS